MGKKGSTTGTNTVTTGSLQRVVYGIITEMN